MAYTLDYFRYGTKKAPVEFYQTDRITDARKEARRQLSIRDDIKDNRIEIWTTHGINESPSREDNMFVEAVERRLKSNYTKKKTPKTNEFGLNWNLR